ncbi:MAG: extracellular solute-binding protein [Ruminococcaceae bacterium]|nr:extracellular solute-binding protein [Oscillospiraceae bacterium]
MKKVKKALSLFMILCLTVAAMSGCGKKEKGTNVDISGIESITENTMPITTEDITLTVWIKNNSQGYAADYEEYEVVKEIEKRTGVKIDFIHPVGSAMEQLNIMLASGDMPDIVMYYFDDSANIEYVEDGVYLDLTEYIEKFAPNFNKLVAENESYQQQLALMGDTRTYFPNLIDNEEYLGYNGYFIRQDWLDKVGMDIPTTIEEWEAVLKAFRDNKLGGKNTVPFATAAIGGMQNEIFASGFGLPNVSSTCLDPVTGKVTHPVLLPGYKDYLETINRWYEEGLIDPNFIACTGQQLDSMVLNGEVGAFYYDNNNDMPKYMSTNPELNLVAVPYPKDKNGVSYAPASSVTQTVQKAGSVVSGDCKYPVEAVRLLDYFYSEEGSTLLQWGIKGETYDIDEDGNKYFTDYVLNNPDGKTPTEAFAGKYFARSGAPGLTHYSAMRALEANFSDEIKTQREASIQYSMENSRDVILPPMAMTEKELDSISTASIETSTYLSEMHSKFLLGKEPLSNFDKFISNAKKIGLTKIIEVSQKVYDRHTK